MKKSSSLVFLFVFVASALVGQSNNYSFKPGSKSMFGGWLLLGPFPSHQVQQTGRNGAGQTGYFTDFLEKARGEKQASLIPDQNIDWTAEGISGTEKVFTGGKIIANGTHFVVPGFNNTTGYAYAELESEKEQSIFLYFSSNGSPKVYVNHQYIFGNWHIEHQNAGWQYGAKVLLKKGLNPVLVKIQDSRGYWGFSLDAVPDAEHKVALMDKLSGFKIHAMQSRPDTLKIWPETIPKAIDLNIPIKIRVKTKNGDLIAEKQGITGQFIALPLSGKTVSGLVEVEISSAEKPAIKSLITRYGGEMNRDKFGLMSALAKTDFQYLSPFWQNQTKIIFPWIRQFVAMPVMQEEESAFTNMEYAQNFIKAISEKKNFIAENQGAQFPIRGNMPGYDFTVSFPKEYEEGKKYPLIINLHGSGGVGTRMTYVPAEGKTLQDGSGIEKDKTGKDFIFIRPLARVYGWNPEHLNNMLKQIKNQFPIDTDRIYLQGHSMGGFGTFNWAMHSPQHFAAISPWSGGGEVLFASRLKNVPIWAFHGQKDEAVLPCYTEMMVEAAKAAGANAKITLFPDAGHSVGQLIKGDELNKFYLAHTRSKEAVPADPYLALGIGKDSVSETKTAIAPQRIWLALNDHPKMDAAYNIALYDDTLYPAYKKLTGYSLASPTIGPDWIGLELKGSKTDVPKNFRKVTLPAGMVNSVYVLSNARETLTDVRVRLQKHLGPNYPSQAQFLFTEVDSEWQRRKIWLVEWR